MILHIMPINDIKEHIDSSTCSCCPSAELQENGDIIMLHNSWDGREYVEQLIEDKNIHKN